MAQREHEETEQLQVPESALAILPPNCALSADAVPPSKARSQATSPRGRPRERPRDEGAAEVATPAVANRCGGCSRKVGLLGFRCRCGGVFCADHRYSERHACSYDYKTTGRDAIARANPVVRAEKILRI